MLLDAMKNHTDGKEFRDITCAADKHSWLVLCKKGYMKMGTQQEKFSQLECFVGPVAIQIL